MPLTGINVSFFLSDLIICGYHDCGSLDAAFAAVLTESRFTAPRPATTPGRHSSVETRGIGGSRLEKQRYDLCFNLRAPPQPGRLDCRYSDGSALRRSLVQQTRGDCFTQHRWGSREISSFEAEPPASRSECFRPIGSAKRVGRGGSRQPRNIPRTVAALSPQRS
jgi:hypothetical protein